MIESTHGELRLLQFERLGRVPGLVHAITTKPQNMAPHRGIERERAVSWRHEVCEELGLDFETLTSPQQVMGGDVLPVETSDVGCGRDGRASAVKYVDGLITDRVGLPMILLSADCPLVCAYDPSRRVLGAVHASWTGTVARAAENMVRMMVSNYGCDPADLVTAIAPSAGPSRYEVGSDVRRLALTKLDVAERFFTPHGDKFLLDLWSANAAQLVTCGVSSDNIEIAGICTLSDDRFWSHRRDGPEAGRFALFIAMV